MTQIYLVPGFFGFTELGGFNYFHRVSEVLDEALRARSIRAEIFEADTLPTGSIRRRAIHLMEWVTEHGGLERKNLHFIGHSTGGLDIRMLLTPGVQLRPGREEVEIAKRTRSVTSLSTPHYGTPLANVFTSLNGRYLLYILTLLASSAPGRYSLYMYARVLATLARFDRWAGQRDNILDTLGEKFLSRFRPERGDALWSFIQKISEDQGAMVQLTPESMDIFNAAVPDRDGVDYISFLSASPPPNPRLFLNPRDIYQSFTHAIYTLSYTIASREHRQYPYPVPDGKPLNEIQNCMPFPVNSGTNDGIVPALSQVSGRLGGAVVGDHLDVVGQFQSVSKGKAYATWLHSGSGFNEERFRQLWADIAAGVARAQP